MYTMDVSTKKIELLINRSNGIQKEIKDKGQKLETLTSFKYLGFGGLGTKRFCAVIIYFYFLNLLLQKKHQSQMKAQKQVLWKDCLRVKPLQL